MSSTLPPTPQVDYTPLLKALQAAPNTAGLAKQAVAQAQGETATTVAALRAQQDQANRQAAVRAQQINHATLAAANFLTGLHLADKLGAGLRSAAQDQANLASGYSGQLQQTVGDAANAVAQHMASLGAPGGVPSTAQQAGNVLYGLGGAIPANEMLTVAPYAVAAARALPAQTIGYGQQQAAAALGKGADAAAQLNPDIAAAYGKLPELQRTILSDLQSAAEKARQDAIGNIYKALQLQQSGNTAEALRAYRQAQIDASNARAAETAAHNAALERDAQARITIEQQRANKPPAPRYTTVTDAKGTYIVNEDTGEKRLVAGPKPSSSGAKVGAPPKGYRYNPATNRYERVPGLPAGSTGTKVSPSQARAMAQQIHDWRTGRVGTNAGAPVTDQTAALTYSQALTRASAQVGRSKAIALVNAEYGTPQSIAMQAANDAKTGGHALLDAIGIILKQPDALPLPYYISALARVYGAKVADVHAAAVRISRLIASGQYSGG